ncbi:hypothetical protein [Ruegeria atlantica]|nr:hypothetical protein [Ruegeria atlantica]
MNQERGKARRAAVRPPAPQSDRQITRDIPEQPSAICYGPSLRLTGF